MAEQLIDRFGRIHTNLRISVTDRCNIRCFYCMPNENVQFRPRDELLTFADYVDFAPRWRDSVANVRIHETTRERPLRTASTAKATESGPPETAQANSSANGNAHDSASRAASDD